MDLSFIELKQRHTLRLLENYDKKFDEMNAIINALYDELISLEIELHRLEASHRQTKKTMFNVGDSLWDLSMNVLLRESDFSGLSHSAEKIAMKGASLQFRYRDEQRQIAKLEVELNDFKNKISDMYLHIGELNVMLHDFKSCLDKFKKACNYKKQMMQLAEIIKQFTNYWNVIQERLNYVKTGLKAKRIEIDEIGSRPSIFKQADQREPDLESDAELGDI
jgi:chromosome segregation ATPase